MVDGIHAAFVFVFVVSTSSAIKCHIYFRRGKSPPKINETDDCESSSCCFTAEINHNRHLYQMKGCDADDIQDSMLVYIPSLSGKSWENIMEACLASECRFHNDLLGGKGETYLCGCDTDFCNQKSFQETFLQLKSASKSKITSGARMPKNNLFFWIIYGSATIIVIRGFNDGN